MRTHDKGGEVHDEHDDARDFLFVGVLGLDFDFENGAEEDKDRDDE